MQVLTINKDRCRGLYICETCQKILPGLVLYAEAYGGSIPINEWVFQDIHTKERLQQLLDSCPVQAITVQAPPSQDSSS